MLNGTVPRLIVDATLPLEAMGRRKAERVEPVPGELWGALIWQVTGELWGARFFWRSLLGRGLVVPLGISSNGLRRAASVELTPWVGGRSELRRKGPRARRSLAVKRV